MAFPNFVYLTNASPGAPRNSGTNGDLCALLDWALPQVGWAIEFSTGNARVYRPAVGNRFRLHVNHDSAVSGAAQRAVVRGCESASSATVLTDPFPTVVQAADNTTTWLVSSLANTTDRPFQIVAWDTGVLYASQATGTANRWQIHGFFDVSENDDPDTWGTAVLVKRSNNNTIEAMSASTTLNLSIGSNPVFFARDISGTIKSSRGAPYWVNTTYPSMAGGGPALDVGYLGKLRRERCAISCIGSTSATAGATALTRRGFVPHLWASISNGLGSVTDADTFTDTAYDPASIFSVVPIAQDTQASILEHTNTWNPP